LIPQLFLPLFAESNTKPLGTEKQGMSCGQLAFHVILISLFRISLYF
jgi:hypothetical protein